MPIFIYFAPLFSKSKRYRFVAVVLTFIVGLQLINNIRSYENPDAVETIRAQWLALLDEQAELVGDDPAAEHLFKVMRADIKDNLKEARFEKQSLLKIIGSIVSLFGVILIRLRNDIGVHFFAAGMLFSIFSSFYLYGFGYVGWTFNVYYLLVLIGFGIFFMKNHNHVITDE